MKKKDWGSQTLTIILFAIIAFNLLLSSWYVLNKDLYFHTDIDRDFLILKEIADKKFILIGPRAGVAGLFHGPLWPYLNFPAYILGRGNPIVVGWFWIFVIVLFLATSYLLAKKLTGKNIALYFTVLLSVLLVRQARELSHPQAAMFVVPIFFFTLLKYQGKFDVRYLILHVFSAGVLIQFETAAGIPFAILSFLYLAYQQIRNGMKRHILYFLLVLIPLFSFLLFDLRHDFFQTRTFIRYLLSAESAKQSLVNVVINRIQAIGSLPLTAHPGLLNYLMVLVVFLVVFTLIRKGEGYPKMYRLFFFLILGYFALNSINRSTLLSHHALPFVPIFLLVFASIAQTRFKKLFLLLFLISLTSLTIRNISFIGQSQEFIGKNEDSWNFLEKAVRQAFSARNDEFGYFIYSPDAFGYEPKYAAFYVAKSTKKDASYFQKKHFTYIVAAPAPQNDPIAKYMTDDWWIKNTIKIDKSAQKTWEYQNGYKIKLFELTPEEISIPFDPSADTGIHFR